MKLERQKDSVATSTDQFELTWRQDQPEATETELLIQWMQHQQKRQKEKQETANETQA